MCVSELTTLQNLENLMLVMNPFSMIECAGPKDSSAPHWIWGTTKRTTGEIPTARRPIDSVTPTWLCAKRSGCACARFWCFWCFITFTCKRSKFIELRGLFSTKKFYQKINTIIMKFFLSWNILKSLYNRRSIEKYTHIAICFQRISISNDYII